MVATPVSRASPRLRLHPLILVGGPWRLLSGASAKPPPRLAKAACAAVARPVQAQAYRQALCLVVQRQQQRTRQEVASLREPRRMRAGTMACGRETWRRQVTSLGGSTRACRFTCARPRESPSGNSLHRSTSLLWHARAGPTAPPVSSAPEIRSSRAPPCPCPAPSALAPSLLPSAHQDARMNSCVNVAGALNHTLKTPKP